jgi:PAS domain-containing protein
LRALARAFSQFDQFDRFVAGLQAALDGSALFEHTLIALDRNLVEGASLFPAGALALPIAGDKGPLGTLQIAATGTRRQFGPEDLHLLAGLADFLGAALTQAQRLQDAGRARELLRLLLNQAPVGIAAYGADRRALVANELALRWLGENQLPWQDIEAGSERFHLRASGKLVFGEIRKITDVEGGAWVLVLQDLSTEQVRLLDGFTREIYRALADGSHCSIAFFEAPDVRNGTMQRLPAVRGALEENEFAGPYDATRIAVVTNASGIALRARLRKLCPAFGKLPGLKVGYAELGRYEWTPDGVLNAALRSAAPCDVALKPAVLIQEGNPAVADTLGMVLGKDFRVVKTPNVKRARELLLGEVFEGVVVELENRAGPPGTETLRIARDAQPGIKQFVTTIGPPPAGVVPDGVFVIEKPFDARALSAAVRAQLN